jgi:hypothetical protein
VQATGDLNSAFNIGGAFNGVAAVGVLNNATQVGGSFNTVHATGGTGLTSPGLNVAFSTLGDNNKVPAGPGPLAIAGVIGKSGVTVTQTTTGIKLG